VDKPNLLGATSLDLLWRAAPALPALQREGNGYFQVHVSFAWLEGSSPM
jgi:hypothetical protein